MPGMLTVPFCSTLLEHAATYRMLAPGQRDSRIVQVLRKNEDSFASVWNLKISSNNFWLGIPLELELRFTFRFTCRTEVGFFLNTNRL